MHAKYQKKGQRQQTEVDEEYAARYHQKRAAKAVQSEEHQQKKPCSESHKTYMQKYKQENKDKINETRRKWTAVIMQDPIQRLKRNLKCQLLNKIRKTAPSTTYLGSNVNFIKSWLEYNFTDEMSWANYGSYWQIDHTIAIHLWDLADEGETNMSFNWKNMMPLEKTKNNRKAARLVPIRVLLQEQRLREFFRDNKLPQKELTEYVQQYKKKFKSLLPEFFMQHAQIAGNP